jgi:phage-related protein
MIALSKVAGQNKEKWAALFPEIRALRGAMGLTANKGRTLEGSMKALTDTGGATGKALGEQAKGGMYQFAVQANRTKNFLIDIGDSVKNALLPVLETMNDVLEKVGEWWKSLSPGMQTTIITIAAVVAAIGPLLVIFGGLLLAVGGLMTMWPVITAAFGTFLAAAGPVVAVIAGVVAGLMLLWDVISSNQGTLDFFVGLLETVWDALTKIWDTLVELMQPALMMIKEEWDKLVQALQPLMPVLKFIAAMVGGVIVAGFALLAGAILVVTVAIGTIIKVIRMVVNAVANFVGWWVEQWGKVGAFFVDIWDKASETVKRWIDNIKGWFGSVAAWVKDKWDGVVQFFKDIMNDIIGFWNEHVASITVNIPNVKGVIGLDGQSFTPFPHITPLAKGGIVLGPTLALIGEAGPEAVVPLRSGAPFGLGGGLVMIRGTLDIGPDGTATIRGIAAEEDVVQSKFQTRIARMGAE